MTAQFGKATQAYRAGKLKASYKMLIKIVRKYPDHQPSHLLLGRILYRSGQIGKAARHFKRVPPDMLTPDAGYEYGITMFTAKDCKRAIAGFARVPKNAREKDLANFYRGICHVRQREYQQGQVYLARAQRLPPGLQDSRRQALQFSKRQMRAERQGGASAGANPYLIVPTPPPPAYPAYDPYAGQVGPPGPSQPPPKPAKAEPPPPPPTGFQNSITPSLTVTQTTTTNDFFGFGNSQTDVGKTDLKLAFKTKYLAAPRASGRQAYFSLGLEAAQSQSNSKSNTTKYIAYENNPADIIEQTTETAPTTSNALNLAVNPEGSFPIGGSMDVTGGFTYKESQPDDAALDKSGSQGPYGSVGIGIGDTIDLKLTFAQTDYLTGSKTTSSDQKIGAEFSKDWETVSADVSVKQTTSESKQPLPPPPVLSTFYGTSLAVDASLTKAWDSFSLTGAANMTQYTPPSGYIKVDEASSNKFALTADKTFEFGGTASFSASMTQLSAYTRFFDDPAFEADPDDPDAVAPKIAAKADGTAQTFLASFKLTPLDWFFTSASYKQTQREFSIQPPTLQQKFQETVADLITELVLQAGVSKTF